MKTRKTSTTQRARKKLGRPPTVHGEHLIALRFSTEMLNEIDTWSAAKDLSRSEAIRELVKMSLQRKK
jgi:hypothetical protein